MPSNDPAFGTAKSEKARLFAAAASSPPGTLGLDVSAWQTLSATDWSSIYANGARFAYIKATEATDYTSSQFSKQYSDAAAAGLIRGAYHFATPNTSSGAAQANYFADHGGGWSADGRTLPPLLDIEYNPYGASCYGLSQSAMVSWLSDFSSTMQARTGRLPAIYSTTNWWSACTGNSGAFGNNPLFIARWPSDLSSGAGTLPAGWSNYTFWQYADSGTFPGDQDVFNGTVAELSTFATSGSSKPYASLDYSGISYTSTNASISVSGWAIDPANLGTSIKVDFYVDRPTGGTSGYELTANTSRPDVGNAYPGAGNNHGFSGTFPVTSAGTYRVCVFPIRSTGGFLLTCSVLTALGGAPMGSLDSAVPSLVNGKAQLTVAGWAFDANAPTATSRVDVYLDKPGGTTSGYSFQASSLRADVGTAYPPAGSQHGFTGSVPLPAAGTYRACAYSIAQSIFGSNSAQIGCRSITIGSSNPTGVLDYVNRSQAPDGTISISFGGWAVDRGWLPTSIPVDVYVDKPTGGTSGLELPTSGSRPDIAALYAGAGSAHGFSGTLKVNSAGTYRVCAYGIGQSPFGNGTSQIGCASVTIPSTTPIGSLDVVTASTSAGKYTLAASGWSFDPGWPASSNYVDVYVDKPDNTSSGTRLTANQARADVGRAYPSAGSQHGFSGIVLTTSVRGTYRACAFGISTTPGGGSSLLGCKTITIG